MRNDRQRRAIFAAMASRRGATPAHVTRRRTLLTGKPRDLVTPLARKWAKRFPTADVHDLASEGTLGLLRAQKLYRRGRGAAFATFAHPHIESRIRRAAQASHMVRLPERKIQKGAKLTTVSRDAMGRKTRIKLAVATATSGGIDQAHARATITRLLAKTKLSAELSRVVKLRYTHDHTVAEVAKALGKSKSTVHALEHKALAQLRAASLTGGRRRA